MLDQRRTRWCGERPEKCFDLSRSTLYKWLPTTRKPSFLFIKKKQPIKSINRLLSNTCTLTGKPLTSFWFSFFPLDKTSSSLDVVCKIYINWQPILSINILCGSDWFPVYTIPSPKPLNSLPPSFSKHLPNLESRGSQETPTDPLGVASPPPVVETTRRPS